MPIIETADGRSLELFDAGDPSGPAILFHHGTPASGRPFARHVRWAEERAVRLVSWSRPGYGGSTRRPGRAVVDVVADALAVADALGIDRFATWGLSGGGPHALAVAARAGNRVVAVASMAGAAPADAADLDFVAGMGEGNVREFGLAEQGEDALRPALEADAAAFSELSVPEFVEAMRPFLSDVDAAALDDELGPYLLGLFREGLARGVDGWLDDDLAFTRPWGFEVTEISVPALVLQGRQDLMVPLAHGRWLARAVPDAQARLSDREGHLTLLADAPRQVHDWLLERFPGPF